jgi:hypothetical protein
MSMNDLQKEYQTRVECFQDFYRNVPSYSNYDSHSHQEEFRRRKEEEESKKKEAQLRTSILFYESLDQQQDSRNHQTMNKSVMSLGATSERSQGPTSRFNVSKQLLDLNQPRGFEQRKASAAI